MWGYINCIPKALQTDICTSPNFDLHAAQLPYFPLGNTPCLKLVAFEMQALLSALVCFSKI